MRSRPTRSRPSAALQCSTGRSSEALGRADRRALRRGVARAGLLRRCARRAAHEEGAAHPRDYERRAETPGERDYTRVLGGLLVQDRDRDVAGPRVDAGRVRLRSTRRSGATAVRVARLPARALERDRDRARPADDRDRRRPDEPRRRRPDRDRQGARARARPRGRGARERRVLPVRRTARSSRSTPGWR